MGDSHCSFVSGTSSRRVPGRFSGRADWKTSVRDSLHDQGRLDDGGQRDYVEGKVAGLQGDRIESRP